MFRNGRSTPVAHVRYADIEPVASIEVYDVVACRGHGDEAQVGKQSERTLLQSHAVCDGNGGIPKTIHHESSGRIRVVLPDMGKAGTAKGSRNRRAIQKTMRSVMVELLRILHVHRGVGLCD